MRMISVLLQKEERAYHTVYDPISNLRSDFGAGPKIWSLLLRANFDSDIHVVPRNIFWLSRVDVGPWV